MALVIDAMFTTSMSSLDGIFVISDSKYFIVVWLCLLLSSSECKMLLIEFLFFIFQHCTMITFIIVSYIIGVVLVLSFWWVFCALWWAMVQRLVVTFHPLINECVMILLLHWNKEQGTRFTTMYTGKVCWWWWWHQRGRLCQCGRVKHRHLTGEHRPPPL